MNEYTGNNNREDFLNLRISPDLLVPLTNCPIQRKEFMCSSRKLVFPFVEPDLSSSPRPLATGWTACRGSQWILESWIE